jgi:23S rRNA pseudouridine955/2504/2580 synthase
MPFEAYTEPMPLSLITCADDTGRRLDRILRKALRNMPLSAIHRLLRQGQVLVNDEAAAADYRVQCGQTITLKGMETREWRPGNGENKNPKSLLPAPLSPIFEGEGLLFINKPSGLQVHGKNSLEELVSSYLAEKLPPSLSFKPGPLHRLDRPSSGLITFSTNLEGARIFSSLMRERKIRKNYLALVEGGMEKAELWFDELARNSHKKKTYCDTKTADSKTALTRVRPLMICGKATLILAEIETGRTHQIRAQAAIRGHPLAGDKKYGGSYLGGGFLLHAWRMEFPEKEPAFLPTLPPLIEAPLPENFRKKILELFGKEFCGS